MKMNCIFCGTENVDDAVYCKKCGKRLDGTVVCENCGQTVSADSIFCPYCGVKREADVSQVEESAVTEDKQPAAKKTLKIISSASALVAALSALIFVFFIGVTTVEMSAKGGTVESSINLFYYFGNAYKDIDKILLNVIDFNNGYSAFFESSLHVPAVFGTVIAALTLLSVVCVSVAAIVRSVRCLAGKTDNTGAGLAVFAFLCYIAGTVALFALNNNYIKSFNVFAEGGAEVYSVKLNAASVAGITLGGLFSVASVGTLIANRGKELIKTDSLVKLILSAVIAVFAIVILALCIKPSFDLSSPDMRLGEKAEINVIYLLQIFAYACIFDESYSHIDNADQIMAYCIIAFIALIAIIIFVALALNGAVASTTNKNKKQNLFIPVVLMLSAVLYLVFTICAAKEFINALETLSESAEDGTSVSEMLHVSYAVPIAVMVLSVVTLAVSIARKCVISKYFKTEAE